MVPFLVTFCHPVCGAVGAGFVLCGAELELSIYRSNSSISIFPSLRGADQ